MTKRMSRTPAPAAADDETRTWDSDDPEIRALSRNREFRALLRRSAESIKRDGGLALDEVPAFRDLTPEEEAEGERLLVELERQTEEEEAARLAARRHNGTPSQKS
jgi:hypothetical protein